MADPPRPDPVPSDRPRPPSPAHAKARERLRFRFTAADRLHGRRAFAAVFAARLAKQAGPLRVHGRDNALHRPRLGLSVSRRVGHAVIRNRIKRRLREAFRLDQHTLPRGVDLVVVVRPHQPLPLADYRRLLGSAARRIQGELDRRRRRSPQG